MTAPIRRTRGNPVAVALYINAALLLAILAVLITRGSGPMSILPRAFGAEGGQPIAGGGSLYLMPGQMSLNTFGCYIMDTDAQTLCAYQFYPGEKELRFVAARNFRHDRRLGNFNTIPDPRDVEKWVEVERNRGKSPPAADRARRGAPGATPDEQ
jgi:hypothetical protein